MGFADKYRKNTQTNSPTKSVNNFASHYRKDSQGMSLSQKINQQKVPQRPDIRQSQNYINAQANAQKYADEAKQANSGWGMTKNFLKATPGALATTLVQTPLRLMATAAELPDTFQGKQASQIEYKVPGIAPFKSYQSSIENAGVDYYTGNKTGMDKAKLGWEISQLPLAVLETAGIGKGIGKGIKAFQGASGVSQGLRAAAPEVIDAFLPTTRGLKSGATEAKLRNELSDLQTQRMRASLAVERPQPRGYQSGINLTGKLQPKVNVKPPLQEGGKTYYHGTTPEIASEIKKNGFAIVKGEKSNGALLGEGIYLDKTGGKGAKLYGKEVLQTNVEPNLKLWKGDIQDLYIKETNYGEPAKITTYLKSKGYDGVEGVNQISIFDPKKVKLSQPQRITPKVEVPNLATKGDITTPNFNYKKFIEENLGIRNKTPDTRGFNKPISQIEKKLSQPGVLAVQDLPQGTPKQGLNRYYPNFLRSGERSIENQGTTGNVMLDLMENQRVAGDLQAGKWKALVNQFTGTLNKEQKMNLTDVLEGKANPMDATVGASSKVMRNLLNKIQREAVGAGLNTGKLENYFPRKYNWSEMIKSGRKEQIYQHMVDTGQAATKAEAEQFFKDFVIKNTERKAGNLEYERMFDIPGYERDPEKALTMYAETAAKRISESKAFGKGDETISALINKISDEGGDYKSAQKIFDYVYKGEDKNAFSRALLGYNAFTKLSLAFFSNLTQSANTAAKGGLLNTIKGASQALAQGIRATRGKSYDDIATLANAFDEHITLQESGLSNKFMKGAMYLFQKVENFNRRTAANTGVLFAKELSKNQNSAYAVRQLKSLGLDIGEIAKGKLTQEQLLTAANKMAKITQFKSNALMMPQAWRTPLGKVLTQFKGFSFMQTKFLRDEVVKEVGKGNFAPLLRFLVIAPVASYVTQSARNWINQSKTQSDFRKGDLYRKAMGDLPSDILTQLQYANQKKDKWYTTPLTNVKNFTSPAIGPTGGDIMQLMSALEQKGNIARQNEQWYSKHPLAQSDPNLDLKRFAAQKIPFIGRNLNNTVFGYKPTVAKDAATMAKEAIERNDKNAFIEAIKKDPYLFNEDVIRNLIDKKIVDMNTNERMFYEDVKNRKKSNRPFFTN